MATIRARRWVLVAGLAAGLAATARADDGVIGTWSGDYVCGQGATGLTLTISPGAAAGKVSALFHFHSVPANPDVPEGCSTMSGDYNPGTRAVKLLAGRWLLQPDGYVTVDLNGQLDAGGQRLDGQVAGPLCLTFDLTRLSPAPSGTAAACRGAANVAHAH